jgi:hypothetical protein
MKLRIDSDEESLDFSKNPTAKNLDRPKGSVKLPKNSPIQSPLGVPNILMRNTDDANEQLKCVRRSKKKSIIEDPSTKNN